jgi:hypothetical protein
VDVDGAPESGGDASQGAEGGLAAAGFEAGDGLLLGADALGELGLGEAGLGAPRAHLLTELMGKTATLVGGSEGRVGQGLLSEHGPGGGVHGAGQVLVRRLLSAVDLGCLAALGLEEVGSRMARSPLAR